MEIKINDKIVDRSSIEIDGIDTQDYPDFCDAYISYAQFDDSVELNDKELEILQEKLYEDMNQMVMDILF
jgi:hypothetical protein